MGQFLTYSLLSSHMFQSACNMATGSPRIKAWYQPSVKQQHMLQMTLKTVFLQEDQEIWNLTFWCGFSFFFVSAACLVSIKNTIWQESNLRNQHPGLREELCPQNYSVLSTSLTGNFSSLSQLLISISKHTPEEKFHLTASSAAGQHCFLFLLPMPAILKIFEGSAVLKSFFKKTGCV